MIQGVKLWTAAVEDTAWYSYSVRVSAAVSRPWPELFALSPRIGTPLPFPAFQAAMDFFMPIFPAPAMGQSGIIL